jgi:hypothetical protein
LATDTAASVRNTAAKTTAAPYATAKVPA